MSNSFETLWTIALQAPLSMGFSRQEYWSGLPFPFPGDLPDLGIEPECPALADIPYCLWPCQMSNPFLPSLSCHEFLPNISEEADLSAAPGLPWFTLTNQSNPTLPTQWVVYKWARGPIPANEIRDIFWRLLRAFLIFMRVTGSQLLLSYWKRIREHTAHNAAGICHKHSGVTNLGQGC